MHSTDSNKQLDKLLVEQSSGLLESMKSGSEGERRSLVDWLLQSKRHVRTQLFMTALDEELKLIDPERRIPIPQVRVESSAGVAVLKPVPRGRVSIKSGRRIWTAAAALLITLAAILTFTLTFGPARWQEFRTAAGEQRAVQLEDGSIVQLNTGSHVKARLSPTSRDIRLLEGEALFKVHQDKTRPFNVYTSDATIVAVGTQFNVYRQSGSTRVSVLEGRVRISAGDAPNRSLVAPSAGAPLLAAGEEAEVRHDGRIDRRPAPDVGDTTAWIQRRIVFKQERLERVVMEFNRYRKTPQFYVSDPMLAARRYSGTFDVDDPKSLQDVLANERDIAVVRDGDVVTIRRRAP